MQRAQYPREADEVHLIGSPWSTKPWEVRWLIWKLRQVRGNIVEIGTYRGETGVELCYAFQERQIHAVDVANGGYLPEDRVGLLASKWPNYHLHLIGDTDWQYGEDWHAAATFIDGCHTEEACHKDTERALAYHRKYGGQVIWHDFMPAPPEDFGYQVHAYLMKRDADIPRLTCVEGTSFVYLDL